MNHKSRLKMIISALRAGAPGGSLLISAAPSRLRSRDTHYPYRQSSDFYYLTGSASPDMALICSSSNSKPILFAREIDDNQRLWEGENENPRAIAKAIGAELVLAKDLKRAVLEQAKKSSVLYFDNTEGSLAWSVARDLLEIPSGKRSKSPTQFRHSDTLLEPMRLRKDESEIALISEAIEVSKTALDGILPMIQAGAKEAHIATSLEYLMRIQGCEVAFNSIVAAGPSAAILHYEPIVLELRNFQSSRKLGKNDLLLIDFGAEHKMYAADITRTFPVSGVFSPQNRALYQIVLEANKAAIRTIRDGVPIKTVHRAAAKVITQGLIDLGLLKGRLSTNLEKETYKSFFPHGIGHSLGIDVHDLSSHRGNKEAVLREGMVITVEPGIYLRKKTKSYPVCGIRIEDDVLVTKRGCEVLSAEIPKEIEDLEAWMQTAGG